MSNSQKPKVLWLGRPIKYQVELHQRFLEHFDVVVKRETTRQDFLDALNRNEYSGIQAVVKPMVEFGVEWGRFDAEIINALPKSVLLFACGGAGYDWVDLGALTARGILYCNSRGAGDEATSDHSVWLIISCFRLSSYSERATRSQDVRQWKEQNDFIMNNAVNPAGNILGCMGMGAIARRTAAKAAAFGLKIHYYDVVRAPREFEESVGAVYHSDWKAMLAAGPDCINVSVPYMKSTHHLIDKTFLSLMKPGSRLVNTARGKVVDEQSLVEALKSGHLLSAGLDVHYNEPEVNPELVKMNTVTLTGHVGGVTMNTHSEFERLSLENTMRVLALNQEPLTPVNQPVAKI